MVSSHDSAGMNNEVFMTNKEKVLVAMSGGVDSSAAAHLILSSGYDTMGGTMRLISDLPLNEKSSDDEINAARLTCERLGIEHTVIDLCEEFKRRVVDNFVSVYLRGETPNPCIVCNKNIKFGALMNSALSLGCDKLATGHYARIDQDTSGRFLLKTATDPEKDQSYMLWTLSQEQLSKVVLPLGELKKSEVRELAASLSFENAYKKDSQDVCFIPDGSYARFIELYTGVRPIKGKYIDMNGNILGEHQGIINYTVGQRKGLGIALGQPMFVHSKSASDNTVRLCTNEQLFEKHLTATDINLIATDKIETTIKVLAKARYRQVAAPATVVQTGENTLSVEFDEPIRAISPGQSVVLYDGDTVIGGGIIK